MIWEDLLKVALIGTDRGHLEAETMAFIQSQGVDTDSGLPRLVLEGAAICYHQRKAGFPVPDFGGELSVPVVKDEERICSARSSHHLRLILDGSFEYALDEFVHHLTSAGQTLPPESLPALFDECINNPGLWQSIKPATGSRGEWLLSLNPEWSALRSTVPAGNWETGNRQERVAILVHLRQTDPCKALNLLQTTWEKDSVADRKAFLGVFFTGLSEADEPFLEKCLSNSRKEIRLLAARLLARIGTSGLVDRLWSQLVRYVQVSRSGKLKLTLPDSLPDNLKRDGIDPQASINYAGGMRAGWIYQVVSRIPPGRWEEYLGEKPRVVLEVFHQNQWSDLFEGAVAEAALFYHDLPWIEAVVRHWMRTDDQSAWSSPLGKKVIAELSETAFNAIALNWIEHHGQIVEEDSLAGQMLTMDAHRWEDRLAMLVIKGFQNWMAGVSSYHWNVWHYKRIFEVAAYRCNPQLSDSLKNGWHFKTRVWARWEQDVDRFLNVMLFRKKMIEEFKKPKNNNE